MKFRIKRWALIGALALTAVTGGMGAVAIDPQPASAAPYGYYDVFYGGTWHLVPTYCYASDWVVRTFYGYYNAKTCRMNHMGYYGIYY